MTKKRNTQLSQVPIQRFNTAPAALTGASQMKPVAPPDPENDLTRTASDFGSPYTILRISNLTSRLPLHEVLRKVARHAENIIGIGRVSDYVNKRLGLTVYLISASKIDAVFLEREFIDYREDGRDAQSMLIVDYKFGRARLRDAEFVARYERIPVSVVVKGLRRLKATANRTHYLADLIEFMAPHGDITFARLNYDAHKQITQNTGFVTFLSQASARSIANSKTPTKHLMYYTPVTTILSDGVPLIVRQEHNYLLFGGLTFWSRDVENANLLMFRHKVPHLHPRPGEPDVNAKDNDPVLLEPPGSADSTTCVFDLAGGTVPFDFDLKKVAEAEVMQGDETSNALLVQQPSTSTAMDVPTTQASTKRPKIEVHDIICMPPNTVRQVEMSDGQTLIISEEVSIDEDSD
jgi:hypothetical protein